MKSGFFSKKAVCMGLCCILLCTVLLSGCSSPFEELEGKKIVFTTGFTSDQVFRIEDASCSRTEIMVYLINEEDKYEASLGNGIWKAEDSEDGKDSIEKRVMESVLSKAAQIKTMNLLAKEKGIMLTSSEKELAGSAAKEYYKSLNTAEKEAMNNITEDELSSMYQEYALADKLYLYTIRNINPEISDDEARIVTVQQIVLKTSQSDESGNNVQASDETKARVYEKAVNIEKKLAAGEDFATLASTYNEAEDIKISFGKGTVDTALETAAFNLDTDEVSSIIETADGYAIIKCISTFDKAQTEANKIRIVEDRKKEAFSEQYDDYANGLTRELNTSLWKSIELPHDDKITTDSFIDVYNKYFDEMQG